MGSTTTAEIRVDGERVAEVEEFDYSSDILAVGEEAHITIANPGGKHSAKLQPGQIVEFLMRDPAVNGGSPTLKHRGRITQRQARIDQKGSTIKLVSADLGWHLLKCCAPLWFNLKRVDLSRLIDPNYSSPGERKVIPSLVNEQAYRFGFKGVRADNLTNRRTKIGLSGVQAESRSVLDPLFAIQAEPGDHIFDIIDNQARRYNRLVNVGVDGFIQLWEPDYKQKPLYRFVSAVGDASSNLLEAETVATLENMYTEVVCVGQQIETELVKDAKNPNAGKKRGGVRKPDLLPFMHRLTFSDPEMTTRDLAERQAEYKWKRSWFDSWMCHVAVPVLHQNGLWIEADTMAHVNIPILNVTGNYYVSSVHCTVSLQSGTRCQIKLREPNLLTAAFGELKDPTVPRAKK